MRPVVLIVKDDDPMHTITVATIITAGFAVLGADSGEAALEELAEPRVPGIAALITDVHLDGDRHGFDLAQRARAAQPDIALILISSQLIPTLWFGFRRGPSTCPNPASRSIFSALCGEPSKRWDTARPIQDRRISPGSAPLLPHRPISRAA